MMEFIARVTGSTGESINGLPPLKERLDPISILAMCALLKFKEAGSRITYTKTHSVFIQEPSSYKIQGYSVLPVIRRVCGQSRDDTDIVEWAIRTAAAWHQPHEDDKDVYRTLFQYASDGLEPLCATYEEKKSTVTAEGIRGWQRLITTVTTDGADPAEELTPTAQKIKDLWSRAGIAHLNDMITRMNEALAQGISSQDEIAQLEALVAQKTKILQKVWQSVTERRQ